MSGRQFSKQAVTITDSLLTTERIPFSDRAGGNVLIPASSFDGGTITFYAAMEPDGVGIWQVPTDVGWGQ